MTFPIVFFLYIYLAFLFVWFIFCLIAIYHILKFGFRNFATYFVALLFIAVAIMLLYTSFNFIEEIDWQTKVTILEGLFNVEIINP